MNKMLTHSHGLLLPTLCRNCLLAILSIISVTAYAFENESYLKKEYKISPDLSYQDTIIYATGDTIAIYISGLDSVYITYAEPLPDSIMESLWVINDPHKEIIVQLSHQHGPVNRGVIGINLSDFFSERKANADDNVNYTNVPNPWQAVADLAPKTLRIFSGASAKFMHPTRSFYAPVNDLTYGGYGYDWTEMISYFDATEPMSEAPTDLITGEYLYEDIFEELEGGCEAMPGDCDWVLSNVKPRMLEFFQKSVNQPTFDPLTYPDLEDQRMYINQCIDLVNFIEDENPGLDVEVIYCVNIESMSASEMMEIIGYLLNNDINLVGVELGNEIYNQFSSLSMGFTDFEHYWQYINGDDYTDPDEQEALELALADDVENDHDYILAIKNQTSPEIYSIKIGLPAMNTPNCGRSYDFPLFAPDEPEYDDNAAMFSTPILADPDPEFEDEDCDCFYPDWNADMVSYYGEKVGTFLRYAFNAIVFHPYFNTTNSSHSCEENSNWRDIMLQLHPEFDAENPAAAVDAYSYSDGPWEYADAYGFPETDTRLVKAFYELAGIHYPEEDDALVPGNFKEFTRDRIDNSFEEHAGQMLFTHDDNGPDTKEVWLTEYNLNDEIRITGASSTTINHLKNFQYSGSNTFAHAAMLQNWMLWNIKASYDIDYKPNFLRIATLQNTLGGSATMLMTNSDNADQVLVEEIADCTSTEVDPYFLRRATYYTAELFNVITKKNLHYLKSTTTMASLNNNLAPSVFLDLTDPTVYVFYTNVTAEKQWFGIDPGSLILAFVNPSEYQMDLSSQIQATILDADQLYSTAGKSALFAINDDYSTCAEAITNENRFELTELEINYPTVTCPAPFAAASPHGQCLELPPISIGYFAIPLIFTEIRTRQLNSGFNMYPNPARDYFFVQQTEYENITNPLEINIYSTYGSLIRTMHSDEGTTYIDISDLVTGIYSVEVKSTGIFTETEILVKIK